MRTKDDLLALMDDALMAESLVPQQEMPRGWRAGLTAIARRSRDVMVRHPWALYSMHGVRMGPNSVRHIEQSLAAGADAPFPLPRRVELITATDAFVFGYALRAAEPPASSPTWPASSARRSPAQAFGRAIEIMDNERRFDFGIQALLDGAEANGAPAGRRARRPR